MRKKAGWLGVLVGLSLGLLVSSLPVRSDEGRVEKLGKQFFEPISWVVSEIQDKYVEPVDLDRLVAGAYDGMLASLDRYGTFSLPPAQPEGDENTGRLGIQIGFMPVEKVIFIENAIPGGVAFRSGILAGDLIMEVRDPAGGEPTKTEDLQDLQAASDILRGRAGTSVVLTVKRLEETEDAEIVLAREPFDMAVAPSVCDAQMIGSGGRIGYLLLTRFGDRTADELRAAIEGLLKEGAAGVIVDLRFNGGSPAAGAIDVADLFLSGGVITRSKGRTRPEVIVRARSGASFPSLAVVLLVNGYSADASELLAGALRDHKRATIVGQRTRGSASMQNEFTSPFDGGVVSLTTARFYTPADSPIEGEGVAPDVEVDIPSADVRPLAVHLAGRIGTLAEGTPRPAVTAPADSALTEAPAVPGAPAVSAAPFQDAQLARAVEVLDAMISAQGGRATP